MARRSRIKFTYQDYRNLPESETKRYELLEGDVVPLPTPGTYHQMVVGNLMLLLWPFEREHKLGEFLAAPCDVVLSDETVVQPDILFVSEARSAIVALEAIRGAPDLVIEVLSPPNRDRDRILKRALYAQYGVQECWMVDLDMKIIEVLVLGELGFRSIAVYGEKDALRSPLLKGLVMPVSEVFR